MLDTARTMQRRQASRPSPAISREHHDISDHSCQQRRQACDEVVQQACRESAAGHHERVRIEKMGLRYFLKSAFRPAPQRSRLIA